MYVVKLQAVNSNAQQLLTCQCWTPASIKVSNCTGKPLYLQSIGDDDKCSSSLAGWSSCCSRGRSHFLVELVDAHANLFLSAFLFLFVFLSFGLFWSFSVNFAVEEVEFVHLCPFFFYLQLIVKRMIPFLSSILFFIWNRGPRWSCVSPVQCS